ncbi:trypco2 family protein [Methylomonas sp. MO1]|uniref:trypco2 family protein n=1 Tax=Methylomonas sp. MO1 TaxID=3073619 RepID=UPI0028A54BEA|nr:trypco2 family protein [Methylomonas sp. MO1]MDT4292329.1 trypco2 family protein [Methylomonas sp. MO1]
MFKKNDPSLKAEPQRPNLIIKNLIRQVHRELLESQQDREAAGEAPIFYVEKMQIEVNFIVSETDEANGGFDFKIITSDIKGVFNRQQIHKVTLSLTTMPIQEDSEVEPINKSESIGDTAKSCQKKESEEQTTSTQTRLSHPTRPGPIPVAPVKPYPLLHNRAYFQAISR